ncbi:hypothetical protein SNE40_009679 [Patella caerulea]|uniref:tRNA (adenine(58)-N(1))-methyltransferase n=1 Tax=Patella caerulea TaxID=87958 RepID=A0AAN8PYU0_PATCE
MSTGHLFTFEFHKERFEKAGQEFVEHGLSDNVTITHRDVCNNGFQLNHVADAVFLDLPSPWSCIDSAKQAMKLQGGRICSFSPCIEQVSQTCATLTEKGFQDITTLECLLRKFHVKHTGLPKACIGELTESEKIQKVKIERKKHMEIGTNLDMVQTDESVAKKPCLKNTNNPGGNNKDKKKGQDCYEFVTASPVQDMQGHTGFLTFATLYGQ